MSKTKPAKEEAPQKLEWGPGPDTVDKVQDKLGTIIAFAFLGKKAFMDGDYGPGGWEKFLESIGSPYGYNFEGLAELAFEGLLRIACEAWQELDDPQDAIEGQVIQRVPAEEPGGQKAD